MRTHQALPFSEEEVLRESAQLRILARRLIADEHAREDLVQEGLLRSLGRFFADREHRGMWLRTTLRNSAAEQCRIAANQRAREQAVSRDERISSPEDIALRLEAIEMVARSLRSLGEPYRSTLTQLFIDGESPRQLARRAGVSVDVVYQRKHRGLELMRADLDRRGGGREAWVALCVPLARRSRVGVLQPVIPWLLPLAAIAGVAVLVLGARWTSGSERRSRQVAARENGGPVAASAAEADGPRSGPKQAGSRRALATEDSIEVQVVRAGAQEPVAAATIQCWPLPEGFEGDEWVRLSLERGLLEERTREDLFRRVADEEGVAEVPRTRHGLLLMAGRDSLWGYALTAPGDDGPVRVEVFPDSDMIVAVEGDGELEGLLVSMSALGYWGYNLTSGTTNARGTAVLRHAGFVAESRRSRGPLALGLSVLSLGGALAWRNDVSTAESLVILPLDRNLQGGTAFADIRIVDGITGQLVEEDDHIYMDGITAGSIPVCGGVATVQIPIGHTVAWEDMDFEVRNPPGSPLQASTPGEHVEITLARHVYPRAPEVSCGTLTGRLVRPDGSPLGDRILSVSSRGDSNLAGRTRTVSSGDFELSVVASSPGRQSCSLWLADENGPSLELSRGLTVGAEEVTGLGEVVVPRYSNMIAGTVVSSEGPLAGVEVQLREGWGGDRHGLKAITRSDGSFEFPDGPSGPREDEEYVLVASHPGFGPHHQRLTVPREPITVELSAPRTIGGRILLDASIPHEKVWIEASGYADDLGSSPYKDDHVATPLHARTALQASGGFELAGLGGGSYTVRAVYYGSEAFEGYPPVLHEWSLEVWEGENDFLELAPVDLTLDFRCARVTVEDSAGTPVPDARLRVEGFSSDSGVDSAGTAVLLLPRDARVSASSRVCFPEVVDAHHGPVGIILERRPWVDVAVAGGHPSLGEGLELCLMVRDAEGRFSEDVGLDGQGRARFLAPGRDVCRVAYRLHDARRCSEEFGEELLPLEDTSPSSLVLPAPPSEALSAAARELRSWPDR